jgi:hypothetical protein
MDLLSALHRCISIAANYKPPHSLVIKTFHLIRAHKNLIISGFTVLFFVSAFSGDIAKKKQC